MATTFRADTVAGIVGVLRSYQAANPSLLRQVRTMRPSSFPLETPLAYVANRTEPSIVHDAGLRHRHMEVRLVIVDVLADNEETMGRLDPLADALLDAFTAAPHLASADAITQVVSIVDGEETDGTNVRFETLNFTLASDIQEGRI